ncbi:hypothetical protein ACFYVL_43695 [Streptomyces sp. NPDC004111]|uniref:hypothetical protein n=1 Tax=Streptomyces sp. NPDC004111 TaxID=3364690 RepID=UPI00368573B4
MHRRHTAIALTATALLALTACQDIKATVPETVTSTPTAPNGAAKAPADDKAPAPLPDFVGQGLQSAQDNAQAAGFYLLKSHDALGRGRKQVLDRGWKVCSQTPKPGSHPTSTTVDFGTVKLEESCPAGDVAEPEKAEGTMPNLVGKSVKVARESLPSNTSLSVEDSSGQGRMILVESNWTVCTIDPSAGSALNGQPVTIGAVKFKESC